MDYIYCPACSEVLNNIEIGDEGLIKFCYVCNIPYFDNPDPCVEVLVVNEHNQVLLLKQNYISQTHWTLVSGYVKNGETLEETVVREVLEETGQQVYKMGYVSSYYFEPKQLIMPGFIAYVKAQPFGNSNEVDELMWCEIENVNKYIARTNNMSGIHFDNCMVFLSNK